MRMRMCAHGLADEEGVAQRAVEQEAHERALLQALVLQQLRELKPGVGAQVQARVCIYVACAQNTVLPFCC